MLNFLTILVCLLSFQAAHASMPVQSAPASGLLDVKAICADPSMTDDERAEIVSRSVDDAVACMGPEWVYGDLQEYIEVAAAGHIAINVSIDERRARVIEPNGTTNVYLISPGKAGKNTKTGTYYSENFTFSRHHRSRKYNNAPMPFAMFYSGDYALHGTKDVHLLGQPASRGCVRFRTSDVEKIWNLICPEGYRRYCPKEYRSAAVLNIEPPTKAITAPVRKKKRSVQPAPSAPMPLSPYRSYPYSYPSQPYYQYYRY